MYFDPADRPRLKAHAKQCMKAGSSHIYLVSLLFLAVNYAASRVTTGPRITVDLSDPAALLDASAALEAFWASFSPGRLAAIGLVYFLIGLFVAVVGCGWRLYTLRLCRGEEAGGADTLFACFRQFGRFVLARLLMEIFVFLWSCLFIIPGIVMSFAYSQTFYLMLDDPDLSPMDALRQSKELMRGHKWELFVLGLSFFGWMLLSLFTFNILNIWLQPYTSLTEAGYYNGLVGWQPVTREPQQPQDPTPDPEQWWKE